MNLSAPFIARPIATTLVTVGITLAGIAAFFFLPVSPLPQVDFPTIFVQGSMAGASPETMATSVATPLERHLGQIADVSEMTSQSSQGSTRIILQFGLDRDINGAARDVQAAIAAARVDLPVSLKTNPTYRKMNPSDAPIMIIALTSKTLTAGQVYDAGSSILAQKLAQISGVGQVSVGGGSSPAVRVRLNPRQLYNMGVTLEDVRTAIANTNSNAPKGVVTTDPERFVILTNDQAKIADEYRNIIVAYKNGAPVRLSDIATIEDSVEDIHNLGLYNGQTSIPVIVFRQSGANIIETVDRVKAMLPELKASISPAIDVHTAMDRTTTIRASLHDVERTLLISICLVIIVVFLFLRDFRSIFIPSIAVPVSLIGTFGVMYIMNYSLDNLSLMALIVSTGFVVDDAIIVLENVTRHLEAGMPRAKAALQGAKEVSFTVVSMSLSLIAVFIPILLMGGIVGRLFREFAVTLSVAVLMSLVVSLTATPMMCAYLLHPDSAKNKEQNTGFLAACGRVFDGLQKAYDRTLLIALKHSRIVVLILFSVIALNFYLFAHIQKGFFPQQDTGQLMGGFQADQSISFQATQDKLKKLVNIITADPAVNAVTAFTGGNAGNMFIGLKPSSERPLSADEVIARLRKKVSDVPGAMVFFQAVQDFRMGGRPGAAQYQYTLQSGDLADLQTWTPKIVDALKHSKNVLDVNSDQQDGGLNAYLDVNRDKLGQYGLSMAKVNDNLYDAFGQRQVSTIYSAQNQYHVVMELEPSFTEHPSDVPNIYIASGTPSGVTTTTKSLVPLSSLGNLLMTTAPLGVNHQGHFAATTISFNLPPTSSLDIAEKEIQTTMQKIGVPSSLHGSFQGTAKVYQDTVSTQALLIVLALLAVYLVLGILYESLIHPFTILSTLPSAGVGAVLALMAFNMQLTIIALIGVILLIGIVKKNAIMMIDFAISVERTQNLSTRDAIAMACRLRFRPIMMTTMAAMFGALPMALGSGEGAELRAPLGISIVGGLIVSQLLTLYTTPVIYLYLDRFRLWLPDAVRRFVSFVQRNLSWQS